MSRIWDAVWTALARSVLVVICCLAFTSPSLAAQEDRTGPDWQPMRIKLVRGDLPACEPLCPEWISMEGQITETTPALFSAVLKHLGARRLPIVVNSFGGSVEGAIKLGRMIRKNGLDVVVATTRLSGCPTAKENCLPPKNADGTYPGFAYDYQAQCNSSCGYMMAGGVRRFAGGWAQVGVHQITTTYFRREPIYRNDYKSVGGKKRVIDRKVVGHKQVTTRTTTKLTASHRGNLTAYFNEMGIGPALLQKALSIPAADMYTLSRDEMKAMKIITGDSAVRDFVSFRVCEALPAPPHCIALADSKPTVVAAAPPMQQKPSVEISQISTSEAISNTACDDLDAANEKTRNTGRYQDIIHDIASNRYPAKLILSENRFDGSFVYENQRNAGWKKYRRPMIESQQNGEPIFENCSRLADEIIGTMKAIVIAADWHRGANRAKGKVWISADTGKLLRTERIFTAVALGYGPQVGATAVEIFTYDRTIEPPPPFDQ
ncbi:hypothetical protein [Candidatus Phyllobacterium onerii]|uniref:COG3904 family protein n=1 Tax=Candidatus Phyllobacterium onerii TaxID=3020828 RepID=UPI00232AF487|nr:hypothetical protein [Phyllobacterium sp. IY22]